MKSPRPTLRRGGICAAAGLLAVVLGACLNPRPDDLPSATANATSGSAGSAADISPPPEQFEPGNTEGAGASQPGQPATEPSSASGGANAGNPPDAGPASDASYDAD